MASVRPWRCSVGAIVGLGLLSGCLAHTPVATTPASPAPTTIAAPALPTQPVLALRPTVALSGLSADWHNIVAATLYGSKQFSPPTPDAPPTYTLNITAQPSPPLSLRTRLLGPLQAQAQRPTVTLDYTLRQTGQTQPLRQGRVVGVGEEVKRYSPATDHSPSALADAIQQLIATLQQTIKIQD